MVVKSGFSSCSLRDHLYFLVRLHGRVVKGVGHLGHDEAMEMEVVSSIPDRGTIVA